MRRIEFIAPVESMRGNLSGNQDLKYAKNDNPAFDAPNGRQYARNYTPRFIGAKRASSGLKYFNTRTKSAQLINDESKKGMACLGGTQAIYAAIIQQQAQAIATITSYYNWYIKTFGRSPSIDGKNAKSVKHWIFMNAYRCLKNKTNNFVFAGPSTGGSVTIHNPWNSQPASGQIVLLISTEILEKFWFQLANFPMKTKVETSLTPELYNGETLEFYTHETEGWGNFVESPRNTFSWVLVGSGQTSTIRPSSTSDVYLEVQPDEGDEWETAHGNTAIGSNFAYRLNVEGD